MSNKNAVGSRVLLRVLFAVLFAFSGLVSCGDGGGSTTVKTNPTTFTITATAGTGGTVTPSGVTTVTQGASQTYTITPGLGFIVATHVVDGVSTPTTATTFSFTSIQANHTFSVTFSAVPTYTITATTGANGTVTPSGVTTVTQGSSQTYTITPALGYAIATLVVDTVPVATSTTYTFTNVLGPHSISATFSALPSFTITATAGANGTVTPSGATTVFQGASQSYTITPNPGYIVATLVVDANPIATSTIYTFINVVGPHSISATFSPAPSGNIVLSLVPARTSGVAPLAVFFDASATTDVGVTNRPFHDLEYTWNFGDPVIGTAGTWAYGAQPGVSSKNSATGPVAAHVFETPGTYTVYLTAFDGTNSVTTNTTITVQDPNTVFSGTNTHCVSANSLPVAGSGGCPSGAAVHQQASFPAIISSYACTGCRVLLKRDDTFTSTAASHITNTGPGILGAYGSGAKPIINQTAGLASDVSVLGFNAPGNTDYTWGDWRVMDLMFNGNRYANNKGPGIDSSSGGYVSLLFLRVDLLSYETAIGFGTENLNFNNNANGRSHVADQLAVFECTVVGNLNTSYSGYNAGNRLAFMGNSFDNSGNFQRYDETNTLLGNGSHALRFPFLSKAVIAHNHILRPGGDRLNIKLHAPFRNGAGNPDAIRDVGTNFSTSIGGDGFTKYVIIADNYLLHGGSGDAQNVRFMVVGPQDNFEDERGHDIIFERNFEVSTHAYTQQYNIVHWPEVTLRNNLGLQSVAANFTLFAQVAKEGGEPSLSNVFIYNNTMHKVSGAVNGPDGFSFVDIPDTSPSNVIIRNNLGYAPTLTGSVMLADVGASGTVLSDNSSNADINSTSPLFATNPPAVVADFVPQAGSYVINLGYMVPVWSDFFRNTRPLNGVIDIGAFEAP